MISFMNEIKNQNSLIFISKNLNNLSQVECIFILHCILLVVFGSRKMFIHESIFYRLLAFMFQQHYDYVTILISDPKDRTVITSSITCETFWRQSQLIDYVGFNMVHKYTRVI